MSPGSSVALLAALQCLYRASASASPAHGGSPGASGCFAAGSLKPFPAEEARDLDPVGRCQQEGSSPLEQDVNVALCRSEGTFLCQISVSGTLSANWSGCSKQISDASGLLHPSQLHPSQSECCCCSSVQGGSGWMCLSCWADLSAEPQPACKAFTLKVVVRLNMPDVTLNVPHFPLRPADGLPAALEPSGEPFLDVSSVVATNQSVLVLFSAKACLNKSGSTLLNATVQHTSSCCITRAKATAAFIFNHSRTVDTKLQAENRVSSEIKCVKMCVEGKRKPQAKLDPTWPPQMSQNPASSERVKGVRVFAERLAYPTNTQIIFTAVADVPDPVEFLWDFGDSTSAKTSSTKTSKRYQNPGRYSVGVVAFWGHASISSEVFPVVIQRAVRLSRLVHRAAVLQQQPVAIICRVSAGTNLTFTWNFGDGTAMSGASTEQHVFNTLGEFTVRVTVFNLVSSSSLSSRIFVVDRPCQPPPVKNMGPAKVQVRRYEEIHLGVTFDSDVDCDMARGLNYSWRVFDSAGQSVGLPLADTRRQRLTLQSHLLQDHVYTATARVQVIGSLVYADYTVKIEVLPSPPVAFIRGGTNIFIHKRSSAIVTLNGTESKNLDFPLEPLSYRWACTPVSSLSSSCSDQDILTTSSMLKVPVNLLKDNFDQFQFTLTVHSGERSASSEVFLTVVSHPIRQLSVYCHQCEGGFINWDQAFTVSAACEDCEESQEVLQYSWSLHVVNASSKPLDDVPFCFINDLSSVSALVENSVTSTQFPGKSPRQTPLINTLLHNDAADASFPPPLSHDLNQRRSENTLTKWKETSSMSDSSGFDQSKSVSVFNQISRQQSGHDGQSGSLNEFPDFYEGSAEWDYYPPVGPDIQTEEGHPGSSAGRLNGADVENLVGEEQFMFDSTLQKDQGSDLVHPRHSLRTREPTLLDSYRRAVDRDIFESYTYTGVSSASLRFRPFSLRPKTAYMLEVTAKSGSGLFGRTQLFFKTNPVPESVMCQVEPVEGMELLTQFSIFCTSGREDLEYKYSYRVGDGPPWTLYMGRDFQYYFSLPSGDPSDHNKVTVYITIRSGAYGSSTKPCPVTVQVIPSFMRNVSSHRDPHQLLLEVGLRNLSALMKLGNGVEILNYINVLTGILNRLSHEPEANSKALKHTRYVLIQAVCELDGAEQESVLEKLLILEDLLLVTDQVTVTSAERVMTHVGVLSQHFTGSKAPEQSGAEQKRLHSLIRLLSYSFQVLTDCTPHAAAFKANSCPQASPMLHEILQTASDLLLKNVLFHDSKEQKVSAGLMNLLAAHLNQTSSVLMSNLTTVYVPASLIQTVVRQRGGKTHRGHSCVVSVLTEVTRCPFPRATYPTEEKIEMAPTSSPVFVPVTGRAVDFSLYGCSTKERINVRSLIEPVTVEFQHSGGQSFDGEYVLLRQQVNYHNFSISQTGQAVQVTVVFTPKTSKTFPIMLLFRMFERPTPSMHQVQRFHHWENDTLRITLSSFYFNSAGVGHLALLDADFGKVHQRNQRSEQISYRLAVESRRCLSWERLRGAWSHHGCRTQQTDATSAVNCSCHQLKLLTVIQQQIQTSNDTADLDPFLSAPSDLRVLAVLVIWLLLYAPVLLWCRRADVVSEQKKTLHFLPDNNPADLCFYTVSVHTGLCSAARMTAKVYIILYGEDGFSQTKELQVPGCTLFRRNSQDTFILSAADSLGPVWGVHIWHDNSGPSPDWYLKRVVVSEVGGPSQLFLCERWLSVTRGDGKVERMLRVGAQGHSFVEMLFLLFSDCAADSHLWISVFCCPHPNSFTHTQRLNVCLLLLLGYACANMVIISHTDDQLPFEVGLLDFSSAAIKMGLLAVAVVLPPVLLISFLFRMHGIKFKVSEVLHARRQTRQTQKNNMDVQGVELQKWLPKPWEEIYQDKNVLLVNEEAAIQQDDSTANEGLVSALGAAPHQLLATSEVEDCDQTEGRLFGNFQIQVSLCCSLLGWTLCLLLSLSCLVLSALLGLRFRTSHVLLWIQSVFVSSVFCIFIVHPVVIFALTVMLCFWSKKAFDYQFFFTTSKFQQPASGWWSLLDASEDQSNTSVFTKLSGARQRIRYLRLVRPPPPAELRKTRRKRRQEFLILTTLRDLCLSTVMLLLMVLIMIDSTFKQHHDLNKSIKTRIMRKGNNAFMSVNNCEDWLKWVQKDLLDFLFQYSDKSENIIIQIFQPSHIVIGDLVIQKTAMSKTSQDPLVTHPQAGDQTSRVTLGPKRSEAASKLELLLSSSWVSSRQTVALKVQFTLYSPAPNLFSSVGVVAEQSGLGVLLRSVKVHSARLYHTPAPFDFVVMVCKMLFLLLLLLQLFNKVFAFSTQQGLMGANSSGTGINVILLAVTSVYYGSCISRSNMVMDAVRLLPTHKDGAHVDVGLLAEWEHSVGALCGIILVLLAVKCVCLAFSAPGDLCSLIWPLASGLILAVAFSTMLNLVRAEGSWAVRSRLQVTGGPLRSLQDFSHRGVLLLSASSVFTALATGVILSSVRTARRSQSRTNAPTAGQLCFYIRQKVLEFAGQHKQNKTEASEQGKTFFLEELESSLDELLVKLNAFSIDVHHGSAPVSVCCGEQFSPVVSPTPQPFTEDTQDCVRFLNGAPCESLPSLSCSDTSLFRSQDGQEIPVKTRNEDTDDCEMCKKLKKTRCTFCSHTVWTENICEKPDVNVKAESGSCLFADIQSTSVVEVLVHKEPECGEPHVH